MADQFILAPYFLDRALPKLQALTESHWDIVQPEMPEGSPQVRTAAVCEVLARKAARILASGRRPVSIAGDCCSALGMAAGLQRAGVDFSLIWFDAHGDFNTWETSPSGFLGGMPLAMLAGRGEQTICSAIGLKPVAESGIILVDGRDLDPLEAQAVATSGLLHLRKVSQLKSAIPRGALWVHMDMDIIDPRQAPAQNYAAPGGPPLEELQEVCDALHRTGRVAAVSVSTWNPDLDSDGTTRKACLAALNSLLGH